MRAWLIPFVLFVFGSAMGQTVVTPAKIVELTVEGCVLSVGTELLPVEFDSKAKFWKDKKPSHRLAFAVDDEVVVRLKTEVEPIRVREISDRVTAEWLTQIRGKMVFGTVEKVDLRTVSVRFDDESLFTYRYNENTKVLLGGESKAVADLKEGYRLFFRGRLLSNLDAMLLEANDDPPPSKDTPPEEERFVRPAPTGIVDGRVDLHQPEFAFVEVIERGRIRKVVYNRRTIFKLDGRKGYPSDIARGLRLRATYRRDQFGRLIASKIELFHTGTNQR